MGLRTHLGLFFFLLSINSLHSQDSLNSVVAKNGDGIFSVLRNNGINPVKYYGDFLKLNENNIRNGSELIVGKSYFLPDAPDSFKSMGTLVNVDDFKEWPIFERELGSMKLKDSTLRKTVYHLVYSRNLETASIAEGMPDFMVQLSNDLLIRGAKVYLYEKEPASKISSPEDSTQVSKRNEFGAYIATINKKYLINNGSFQRVLIFQQENQKDRKDLSVAVHHFDKGRDGKRLANSLQDIFKKNWKGNVVVEEEISQSTDEAIIYLAKNVLPSVTTIDFNFDPSTKSGMGKSSRTDLAKLITSGILNDYSNTGFSD